jgi:TusA-related sulfurtransferase
LEPGERLIVVGDDPDMLVDLPRLCEESGNRLIEIREDGGLVRCVVERVAEP